MDGLLPLVLGANQGSVLSYFSSVWTSVRTLTAALEGQFAEKDEDKFKDYVEAEEERLKTNLEAVNYIIDGLDTLSLITGPGRIEKVSGLPGSGSSILNFLLPVTVPRHLLTHQAPL